MRMSSKSVSTFHQKNNMVRRLLYIAVAVLALTSCRHDIEEILLERSDISLTVKGDLLVSFNENTCQLGYNSGRNEYRVYDEKFANWFILRCHIKPTSEGQTIKADLEYTTTRDTKKLNNLEFSVEKTSSEGLIWLWNKDKQIGIVLKQE